LYILLEERNKIVFLSIAIIIFTLFIILIIVNQIETNKISNLLRALLNQQFNKIQKLYIFDVDFFCRIYAFKHKETSTNINLSSELVDNNKENDFDIKSNKFSNIELYRMIILSYNDEETYNLCSLKNKFTNQFEISSIEMLNLIRNDYSSINRLKILTMSILIPTIIIIFIGLTIWKVAVAFNLKWSENAVLVIICVSGIIYLYTIIYIFISIIYHRSEDRKFSEFYQNENLSNYAEKGIYYFSKYGLHYLFSFKPIKFNSSIKNQKNNINDIIKVTDSINSDEESNYIYPDIRIIEPYIESILSNND
jgi:hypothetical protein